MRLCLCVRNVAQSVLLKCSMSLPMFARLGFPCHLRCISCATVLNHGRRPAYRCSLLSRRIGATGMASLLHTVIAGSVRGFKDGPALDAQFLDILTACSDVSGSRLIIVDRGNL